jgi:transcriptional regulator with PAS, ATPase and Fis domain
VRELENVIRSAVDQARAARAELIRPQDLPGRLTKPKTPEFTPPSLRGKVDKVAKQARKAAAHQMMKETGGNAQESARRLSISESYLYRLLREKD